MIGAICALVACDKLLDTTSEVAISSSSVFQSPSRIEGLVNGAYKSLKSANLYSGRLLMYGDLRGEEFVCRTENALAGGYVWANDVTNLLGEVNQTWAQLYRVINNANVLIDGLEKSNGVISDELKRNYLGEARFIRALSYFNLVTIYGRPYVENQGADKAIPLRLLPEVSSSNNDLARSTVKDVYDQVLADLDYAEANLPTAYPSNLLNTTRAHRNTAIALKTRVYLNKGDFANVRAEAGKIVSQGGAPFAATSGVPHKLEANIATLFSIDYTTAESIFSMPMTVVDPPSGSALTNVYYYAPDFALNIADGGIVAEPSWPATDSRRQFVFNNSGLNLSLLAKYLKRNPNIDYVPVIRYAEVLLNYAEAEARGGNLSNAVALLKAIRNRSDAAYAFPEHALSSSEIVNTIRTERRIELLGEGFRANDILRDLLVFPDKPSLSSYTARVVRPADNGYVFPLPNDEILTNKRLLD